MRNEEFEIVRDLMARRGQELPVAPYTARAIEPASFREIDGHELARQYVAHRKFRESERLARQSGADDDAPDRISLGSPDGDRRPSTAAELPAFPTEEPDGWLTSLARRLGWR
jgi:hypothetical protein